MTDLVQATSELVSRRSFLYKSQSVAIALAAGGLIAGCGSASDAGSGGGSRRSGTIRLTKSAYEPDDRAHLVRAVQPFVASHPGARVDVSTFPAGSIDTYLTTMFAGSSPADVVLMPAPQWPRFAREGALVDLTSDVRSPAFQADAKSFVPSLLSSYELDGKSFVVPYAGAIFPTWVNLDLLERAGHDDWNTSYASMLAAARAVRKGDTYGFAMNTSYANFSYYWWLPYIWQAGADLYNRDASAPALLTQDSPAAWSMLAELFQSGAAPKPGQYDFEGLRSLFVAGRLAILPYSTDLTSALVQARVPFRWAQTFGPPGPHGQTMAYDYDSLAIASRSKNSDLAWELISYLSGVKASDEYLGSFGFQLLGARTDQPELADRDRYSEQIVRDFVPKARSLAPSIHQTAALQAACAEFERCLAGKPADRALADADAAIGTVLQSS